MKIGLFAAQLVLPAVPGLYVILFRPGVSLLTPRMLIPSMLCINLLAILLGWRRLGWSRNERLDAAMLLVMFALFPWLEYRVLPVGAFEGNLWAQVGCYCAGQAIGYVSVVLAPDWLGRLRQRRYDPARRCWNSGPKRRGRSAGRKSCAGRRNKNISHIICAGCLFFGRVPRPFPTAGSLPAHQPIGSSVCQSADSSVLLSVCQPVSSSARLSASPPTHLPVSPSVRRFARRVPGITARCRFTGSAGC